MTDLPKCRICQSESFRMLAHGTVIHPTDKSRPCALNGIEVTPAQLTALMGADRDGVRYRWLRDNGHLDVWWSVEGPADRCANIDADIDTAMGEQQ